MKIEKDNILVAVYHDYEGYSLCPLEDYIEIHGLSFVIRNLIKSDEDDLMLVVDIGNLSGINEAFGQEGVEIFNKILQEIEQDKERRSNASKKGWETKKAKLEG